MSNLESNKEIAKYMEYEILENLAPDVLIIALPVNSIMKEGSYAKIYQPDKDWNQLMQVVEKIAKDNKIQMQIYHGQWPHCLISNRHGLYIYRENEALQLAVYQAVVEYVSDFNKEKQNETK